MSKLSNENIKSTGQGEKEHQEWNGTKLHIQGNIVSSKNERLELQTKAITSCDKLSCFVELSMNLNIIGDKTVENWQKQIKM